MKKNIEILAPAGSKKQLEAAISAGADAVYLGLSNFSARAGAENFSEEDLHSALINCHKKNVKVYVAINTLIKDSEMKNLLDLIDRIYLLGVDAVIIQDYGLLSLIKDRYSGMEIHASTQMSIHNKDGSLFVKEKGVSRVILARELSLSEIKDISNQGIDTEVFIHGAICISYSGQCRFSINKGKRSANRGSCAQPCRQSYDLFENGVFLKKGFLISPKERSLLDDVKALRDIGVKSLKIEGRLRNEYYVYEVVRQYKNALNNMPHNINPIAQIFNRDGFTSSYIRGKVDSDMITTKSGSNTGIYLGKINKGEINLKEELSPGDGVSIQNGKGFIVTKLSKLKNGNYVIFPRNYNDGDLIFKTSNAKQKKEIEESIKNELNKDTSISVSVKVLFSPEEKICIEGIDFDYKLEGDIVEYAKKAPITKEKLIEQLEKKSPEGIKLKIQSLDFKEGFLPISSINQIRREWIKEYKKINIIYMGKKRSAPLPYHFESGENKREKKSYPWETLVILSKKEQLDAFFNANLKKSILCINPYFKDKDYLGKKDIDLLEKENIPYFIQTREIIREEMDDLIKDLKNLNFLSGILTGNLGLIQRLKEEFFIIGDVGLNIYNSYGENLFPELDLFIPSCELPEKDLLKLKNKDVMIPLVYSKERLMAMEYCPNKNGEPCLEPCRNNEYRLDGYKLQHDKFCRVSILNDEFRKIDSSVIKKTGFSKKAIILTDESYSVSLDILNSI